MIYWLSFGFGAMFLAIWFGLLRLGSSPDGAPALAPDVFLAAPLFLLLGIVPWALVRIGRRLPTAPGQPERWQAIADDHDNAGIWVGSAASPLMLVVSAASMAVTAVLAFTGENALLTVAVGILIAGTTLAFGSVHVAIDEREVRARSWIGLPRKTIQLGQVAGVRATETSFAQWGGLGYRVGPRGSGFIVRSGPAIEITTREGAFTVTVDGANEGADMAQRIVGRGANSS